MPNHRLDAMLSYLTVKADDVTETAAIKQQASLRAIRHAFALNTERLEEIKYFLIHEMHQGLAGRPSTLKMLPTYVYRRETSHTTGLVYALDLGGTNFRVIRMQLRHGELVDTASEKFRVPENHMKGTADGLFGFIANAVLNFAKNDPVTAKENGVIPIGFTFSFPVSMTAINKGELLEWTKGFTASGVVGQDVVALLQNAINRDNSPLSKRLRVVALCNDTVGTLIGRYFVDSYATVGVILGTGANACYWERSQRCPKDATAISQGPATVVNMEFGNFDSDKLFVLPITSYDDAIDEASVNPRKQRFEKLISGMYLGEIARRVLCALSSNGSLPPSVAQRLNKPDALNTEECATISSDRLPGLYLTYSTLKEKHGIICPNYEDRRVVRDVCYFVIQRAAQLAGTAIAAALMKSESFGNATVAIDGSVFEKTPYFKPILMETLKQLLPQHSDVRVVLQKEGSGLGAGYIAALACPPAAAKAKL